MMPVSVIIPVFNAAVYVQQAVASALAQPETGEIILVEDGSKDNSLAVCERLAAAHTQVRLFRHHNGENRGAGASRNLGVGSANCPYVAFLDADDIFLPGRFTDAMEVFSAHPDADGVYESTGIFFEDEESRRRWMNTGWPESMGMRKQVEPDELFDTFAAGGAGSFCTDSIVVRRSLFEKSGYFKPEFRTVQDMHLWLRMAAVGRFYPGKTDGPVSLCRIHARNRVTGCSRKNEYGAVQRMWGDVILWGRTQGLSAHRLQLLSQRFVAVSNMLVMQEKFIGATQIARHAIIFIARNCPQPWRVAGFVTLLGSAIYGGLLWTRTVDLLCRSSKNQQGSLS